MIHKNRGTSGFEKAMAQKGLPLSTSKSSKNKPILAHIYGLILIFSLFYATIDCSEMQRKAAHVSAVRLTAAH